MSVNLHIERLILDGLSVPAGQGPHLAAAMETELARLLATSGLEAGLRSGGAWPSVPAGSIRPAATKPASLGQQIARAVYRGIGPEPTHSSSNSGGSLHAG
jgi:hypothetical protein